MLNQYYCFSTVKTVRLFTFAGIYLFFIYVKMKRTEGLEEHAPVMYNIFTKCFAKDPDGDFYTKPPMIFVFAECLRGRMIDRLA